mmetsp:Transcript_17998/g.30119  ORF Transcript_17998/g.30119 Transcript_17998/m.30119 type:complete len:325 (-) Transcript_17998:32-1006(-)
MNIIPVLALLYVSVAFIAADNVAHDDHCEYRKNLMFDVKDVDKNTELNNEWHALIKQAHRDELSDELFSDADIAHYVGPVGPPCANPLTSFDFKNSSIKGCFKDVQRMDVKPGQECIVMSIGLHDHWQFEKSVHEKTSCKIELFDCLAGGHVKVPDEIKDRTDFHDICIGERDEIIDGKQFMTWSSMNKLAGHGGHVSYLKIHADGYEHSIFRDILTAGIDMLPTQVLVSLHAYQEDHFHKTRNKFSRHHMIQFFQYMYEKGGYHVIDESTADDCYGNDCIQLLFAIVECHPHKHTKLEKTDLHKAELQVRINFLISERFPHLK